MPKNAISTFDDLVKVATGFVTKQKGVWDHNEWTHFLENVQKKGLSLSANIQPNLGAFLEATKRFYSATASVKGVEGALSTVTKDGVQFIKDHRGIWSHDEWEAFVTGVQKNSLDLSQETIAYLGGILETLKELYLTGPVPVAGKPAGRKAAKTPPSKSKTKKSKGSKTPASSGEKRDNLTVIDGIGPAYQKKLNAEGIVSLKQIAELSDADIAKLEKVISKVPGRIKRENWVNQARKLC